MIPGVEVGDWRFIGDAFSPRQIPGGDAPTGAGVLKMGDVLELVERAAAADGSLWLLTRTFAGEGWIPEALASCVSPANRRVGNLPIGEEVVDRWRGLPADYAPDDLAPLPMAYRVNGDLEYPLRAEAREAAIAMFEAARREGLWLKVVSAYRPADRQRSLYLAKIEQAGYGQRLVAKPGHSEHQLGVAIDVAGSDLTAMLKEEFGATAEGKWLQANASRFGFVISYTHESRTLTGYDPEPWHLRYVGVDRAPEWSPAGAGWRNGDGYPGGGEQEADPVGRPGGE